MTIRTYSSPEAFKQALEQRLRTSAKSGAEFARKRQLLVFDRFLARVVAVLGDAATLKGGLVLELRIERARTTKDVDLRVVGSPDDILARLQEAGRRDLGDFLTFEVGPDEDYPEIQNDGMQYDGLRFRAECKLAGEGPPRHRPARDRAAHRCEALARGSRADLHVPQDARAPRNCARAAWRLDDALRSDGPRRPAGVAHSRRGDQGGPDLSRSRPRRSAQCNLGARDLVLAVALNSKWTQLGPLNPSTGCKGTSLRHGGKSEGTRRQQRAVPQPSSVPSAARPSARAW
jgi:hypothetical protein